MTDRAPIPPGDTPGAAAVIDEYFDRLRTAAAGHGTSIAPDDLAELRAHVDERLHATAHTAADATDALADLGTPEALAQAFADDATAGPQGPNGLVGRVLGMPYDVRPPTSDRLARRVWDPTNPKILVPKVLGLGWTVNFGALAVRTRLVRPDDEDDPFTSAGSRVVAATLAAPVAAAVALGALVAATWTTLPATVPTHWGLNGRPDGYGSPAAAVIAVGVIGVVPVLLAAAVHLRGRHPFARVAASAVSLGLTALAGSIYAQTLFTVRGGSGVWPTWAGVAAFVVLPFGLLVTVSRRGRAAEQRRDLSSSPSKGTAR